jgi:hypothetical protein
MKGVLSMSKIVKNNSIQKLQVNEMGLYIVSGHLHDYGKVLFMNSILQSYLEWTSDDIKGSNMLEMIPDVIAEKHQLFVDRFYVIGESAIVDNTIL